MRLRAWEIVAIVWLAMLVVWVLLGVALVFGES